MLMSKLFPIIHILHATQFGKHIEKKNKRNKKKIQCQNHIYFFLQLQTLPMLLGDGHMLIIVCETCRQPAARAKTALSFSFACSPYGLQSLHVSFFLTEMQFLHAIIPHEWAEILQEMIAAQIKIHPYGIQLQKTSFAFKRSRMLLFPFLL